MLWCVSKNSNAYTRNSSATLCHFNGHSASQYILIVGFHFSISNGKYMDEIKYSNMHNVEQKYTNCHIDDHSIKTLPPPPPAQYAATTTTNLTTVGALHTDDVADNNMAIIKSEDANVTHSYVLPPFLHWIQQTPKRHLSVFIDSHIEMTANIISREFGNRIG